jgi:hypothetical protein
MYEKCLIRYAYLHLEVSYPKIMVLGADILTPHKESAPYFCCVCVGYLGEPKKTLLGRVIIKCMKIVSNVVLIYTSMCIKRRGS